MQPRPNRLDVYYCSDLVGAVHDSAPLAFEYSSTWLDGAQMYGGTDRRVFAGRVTER